MMTIEVKINDRVIASVEAINVSDLAPVSDYDVHVNEPDRYTGFILTGHERAAGAWELVRRIAEEMINDPDPRPASQYPEAQAEASSQALGARRGPHGSSQS